MNLVHVNYVDFIHYTLQLVGCRFIGTTGCDLLKVSHTNNEINTCFKLNFCMNKSTVEGQNFRLLLCQCNHDNFKLWDWRFEFSRCFTKCSCIFSVIQTPSIGVELRMEFLNKMSRLTYVTCTIVRHATRINPIEICWLRKHQMHNETASQLRLAKISEFEEMKKFSTVHPIMYWWSNPFFK